METMVGGRRAALALGLAGAAGLVLVGAERATAAAGAVKATVLYGAPKDPAAFEKYYLESHMPKVYAIKGIDRIELAKLLPGANGAAPPFYRITELWFASPQALEAVAATPEWKAIVADVPNFATGGATVFLSTVE
jgi:uncharacterized protein (TIGR02118 family)